MGEVVRSNSKQHNEEKNNCINIGPDQEMSQLRLYKVTTKQTSVFAGTFERHDIKRLKYNNRHPSMCFN
jgi:hypothetical protein